MDVSIIIPCYNSGKYLDDALNSITTSKGLSNINYEVIIVNDGSTDKATVELLGALDMDEYRVIHQLNQGPAAARNTGVKVAQAPNLLFLDCDNKVKPNYISTAYNLLKKTGADVIYGKPEFFGDSTRCTFTPGPFDMNAILLTNYIDTCSMIRKKVWDEVGGFDEAKILIGFEDWEFWIRVGGAGFKFQFVDEFFYDYRIDCSSLLAGKNTKENYDKVVDYVYEKHARKVQRAYRQLLPQFQVYKRDQSLPVRSFFKFFYMKYIKPFYSYEKKWQKALKEQ